MNRRRPAVIFQGEALPKYDAIIPRIGASYTMYGTVVVRQFEVQGVFPVNESQAITRARDKLRSLQLLAAGARSATSRSMKTMWDSRWDWI